MSERVSEEAVNGILTSINNDYSEKYQLNLLKFLAQSVVQYGLLEKCRDVFDVYRKMRDSPIRKSEDYHVAVSLLRHFLQITGCKQASKLSAHCCEEFDLTIYAPSLTSYQLLFSLACKLVKNFDRLFRSIGAEKLSKPKYDLRDVTSPVELFQSMICKGALHPSNPGLLKQELVAILKAANLKQELEFVQCYINHPQNKMTPLYDFEGHSISGEREEIAVRGPVTNVFSLHLDTNLGVEEVNTDTDTDVNKHSIIHYTRDDKDTPEESEPLLGWEPNKERNATTGVTERVDLCEQASNRIHSSEAAKGRHPSSSPKKKLVTCCCVGNGSVLCFMIVAAVSSLIYASMSSQHSHTQPIFGYRPEPFVYSPFSNINLFYDISIRGAIHGDVENDDSYNLTVCATSCPLNVTTSQLLAKGICSKESFNCYVNLLGYQTDPGLDSRYYSRYMLINSNVTFTITDQSQADLMQLCITTDNDTCRQFFMGYSTDCPKVLDFNQVNNYSQTFTAPIDSYYCAVWLIKEHNHSINYTVNLTVVSYQLPTSGCKNFDTSDFTLDLLSHQPKVATHNQDVCILVIDYNAINQDSNTLSTNVVTSSLNNIAFVLCMIFLFAALLVTIVMIIICYKIVKRSSCCTSCHNYC